MPLFNGEDMGLTRQVNDFLIINGYKMPSPAKGFQIIHSINVDSGRNLNGEVIGQRVGRQIWKLNNLSWKGLNESQVSYILNALEPFFVKVTFTGTDNKRHTVTMYPGDKTGQPLFLDGVKYIDFDSFSFNLIDCGYIDED